MNKLTTSIVITIVGLEKSVWTSCSSLLKNCRYLEVGALSTELVLQCAIERQSDIRTFGTLQSALNAAARLVCSERKYDHVTPLLRDLRWLRVPERI